MNQGKNNSIIEQAALEVTQNAEVQQHAEIASFYLGPLPPPIILKQYEEAEKGAANRIITLTEDEAKHRRVTETRLILVHFAGILFAFLITIFIIGLGAHVILQGHSVAGTLLCGAGVTGLIGTFVHGSKSNGRIQPTKSE